MIAHSNPPAHAMPEGGGPAAADAGGQEAYRLERRPSGEGRDGPVRVPLRAPSGRQGPRLGTGFVPRGARPRRLRWPLLLSGARPAGARCRRPCAARRDRNAHRRVLALFRSARAILARTLRHERDAQDRRRGPRGAERRAQDACRHHQRGDVRRSRPQISNLGARPLSRGTRGGHREGPRVQAGTGHPDGGGETAWSTGMMTGSGSRAVAGGPARHGPVLARGATSWLGVRDGGIYVDATLGAGSYSRAILTTADARVIGIDRAQPPVACGARL